jgi:aspartate/methionine/tyrosine aminotransferase
MASEASAFAPFEFERWCAACVPVAGCDLSPSGAPPLRLDELLAFATPSERDAFAAVPLGYGPASGDPELRRLVARRHGVRAHEVLVTCGAIEALLCAVSVLVRAGDEVVVQQPMYPAVAGIARGLGATVVPWRLAAADGFRPRIAALARLLSPRTRLVAVTQPNGPTGSVLEEDDLAALVEVLEPRGIWLLSDEVYRDLVVEAEAVPSAACRYERALSVGDVAKPFGLGGLRIGLVTARDADVRERIVARRDYTTLSAPTPSGMLAAVALRHADALLARPIRNARANISLLADLASRDNALSFVRPRAGVTAFVGVAGAASVQRRLAAAGVLVVPGSLFGDPERLRVWLGGPPGEFRVALEQLGALL